MKRIAILALALTGCAMQARMYDLNGGPMLSATYTNSGTGRGDITITHPDGECRGEYKTVTGGSWGAIFSQGSGRSYSGQSYGLSLSNPGAAVATCPSGRVIECEYMTGGGGTGYCQDNKGGRYRLMF